MWNVDVVSERGEEREAYKGRGEGGVRNGQRLTRLNLSAVQTEYDKIHIAVN